MVNVVHVRVDDNTRLDMRDHIKDSPVTRAVAKNTLWNLFGQAVPLVIAALSVPYLVHRMGSERFGLLSLAWVVVGYFAFFDLGLGRAATRHVAAAIGSGTIERVPSLAWTAILTQTVLGLVGCVALILLTPFLVHRLFHIPGPLSAEATRSFVLLALSLPVTLITGSLRGLLEAAQRFDLVNWVRVPLGSANYLLPCLGARLGWSLPPIVGLLVASSLVTLLAYGRLSIGVFPSIKRMPAFNRQEFTALVRFGSWVTVSSILGPLLVYLDRFVVGIVMSVAAIAYYSAPYEMVSRLLIVAVSVVSTLFPVLSAAGSTDPSGEITTLLSRAIKYLLIILAPITILIVIFSGDILLLWLGSEFAQKSAVALSILSLGVLINSVAQLPYAVLQAQDRPDLTAKVHMLETPLYVLVVWVLVTRLGISGAALAWSLRVLLDACLLMWLTGRVSGIPIARLTLRELAQVSKLLSGTLAVGVVISISPLTPMLRLSLGALTFAMTLVGLWRYYLSASDRQRLRTVFKRPSWPASSGC